MALPAVSCGSGRPHWHCEAAAGCGSGQECEGHDGRQDAAASCRERPH